MQAFANHLADLRRRRKRLDALIRNGSASVAAMNGEVKMTDQEKFKGFKQSLVDENEKKYGAEVRAKYGDQAVDESNAHVMGMTKAQYEESEKIGREFERTLKAAFDTGDPAGALAQKACELHKLWLCVFYPKYSKAYHKGLVEMYLEDDRFAANFEKIALGCTQFLRDAVNVYCE